MSIAVSAIVVPSRRLRALTAGFALANLGAAAALAGPLRERFMLAPLCAAFFLVAGLCLLLTALHKIKTRQIDISGLGQLRLTVQQELRTNEAGGEAATPVTLLAGSTVWPQLMLLLLRSDAGALTVLQVLRDSVAPQQFRALIVAVRAAGASNAGGPEVASSAGAPYHPQAGKHKIL
jgi:toxin CptA